MTQQLPSRFSEKAFRRYEPIIANIARDFPKPVVVYPSVMKLSPETVRGRLKDAIESRRKHRWPSERISYPQFSVLDFDSLIVSLQPDGNVVVGTKETIKEKAISVVDIPETIETLDFAHLHDLSEIKVVCLLAHYCALRNKIRLCLPVEWVRVLTTDLDISLVRENDSNLYILQ